MPDGILAGRQAGWLAGSHGHVRGTREDSSGQRQQQKGGFGERADGHTTLNTQPVQSTLEISDIG